MVIEESDITRLWESKYKALVTAKLYGYEPVLRINSQSYGTWCTIETVGGQYSSTKRIARFSLDNFPMADAVISISASVDESFQKRGIGTLLNQMRVELAGGKPIFCTVNNTNAAQHKVLLLNKWKRIGGIDETSSLWVKGLRP